MENEEEVKAEKPAVEKTPEEEEKEKKKFYYLLSIFIIVGFVAPIVYLVTRYNLFKPTTTTQIGLWGVIVFGIVISLIGTLCWYYIQAMKFKYSIWKQIISGALKVLAPLMIAALALELIKDNVDLMIESLWVFFGCEALAIPINPLPKWAFEHNIDSAGDVAKQIYDKIKASQEAEDK